MPVDRLVRYLPERLIGTGAALDARLAADSGRPLVGADRRIARLARPGVVPALRIDVLAAAKPGSEQCDLVVRGRTVGDRSCGRRRVPIVRPVRLDLGETGLEGRLLGLKTCKPLAYERGFLVVG